MPSPPALPTRAQRQALYDDPRWKALRSAQLKREPLCRYCVEEGKRAPAALASLVNHRTPHRGDPRLFFDPANLESCCKPHHDSHVQSAERSAFGIVRGADAKGWPLDPKHPWNANPRRMIPAMQAVNATFKPADDLRNPGDWCFRVSPLKGVKLGIVFVCPCGRPDCRQRVSLSFSNAIERPEYPLRDLTAEEKVQHAQWNYAKYEEYPPSKSSVVGRYWTQAQLDGTAPINRPAWEWDGNERAPTLKPSILHYNADRSEHWHGYLTAGVFKPC